MDNLWIVVAQEAGARIFSRNRPLDGLKLLETIEHPEGRMKNREIDTDRPGRIFTPTASPRVHGLGAPVLPHDSETIRFMHQLAHHLETARAQNRFFRLVLVAGPQELGMLRGALDKRTQDKVLATLNKNLARVRDIDMEDQLYDVLSEADGKLALQRSA